MTDQLALESAKRAAELSRFELESALDRLDLRVQSVAATAHKVLNYGKEAERLAREYPYVNLAIFVSAGFILGSFFRLKLNHAQEDPEIIPGGDLHHLSESGVAGNRLGAN